ncbi:hypothetical protein NXF25_017197 [Crotalus adamanteus]|uniref:Uncharacterized protein n=1 Tax=Crotalus adamanteus TaxID=8729 RepID=A0AAW1ARE0_CROAD
MQFQLNTDSPGPAAYSPPTMACRETIAPSYTFGWKTPPRGTKSANRPNTPNFSFGQRGELSLANKGTLDEPGPNQYNIERAYTLMLHRSPSIIINPVPVTLFRWVEKEGTPGPGAYNVDKGYNARLPRCPGFYIQGVRRPKKHETGPFSTL